MTNYCFTDVHGDLNLLTQILNYCKVDDKIYFLGDAADRGSYGIECMLKLLNDPRVIYIKGNHEMFLEKFLSPEGTHDDIIFWMNQGGYFTYNTYLQLPKEEQDLLRKRIEDLPIKLKVTNCNGEIFLLSHAGMNPSDFYDSTKDTYYFLENREHYYDYNNWDSYENYYIIHGHTPTSFISYASKGRILKYDDDRKVDLDIGSYSLNKIALFNLDTKQVEKYFYN